MSSASNGHMTDRVDVALADVALGGAVKFTTDRLRGRKAEASEALGDWQEWREAGRSIRAHTVANLDYYVDQFTTNATAAGSTVHFASDGVEAVAAIRQIVREKAAKLVIKSKSMVTEEIHLNAAFEADGLECVETDLGEYILQLAKEPPSHIIVPCIHKRRSEIAALFSAEAGREIAQDTVSLTAFARQKLRETFIAADIGITGCNFALADTGSIVLFSNEGNGRMTTTLPKTHVVVMGMERLLPTFEDLDIFAKLLPRSATGQKITSYMTVLTGPRRDCEVDGPDDVHIVILDNGRSNQLGDPEFQEILNCIRCGACLNVCPVYRHVGGHAYGNVYPGPIGAVLAPLLRPDDPAAAELPYASSLCGACAEACPVKIPLHDMLVRLRARNVARGNGKPEEQIAFTGFAKLFGSASLYGPMMQLARLGQKLTVGNGRRPQWFMNLFGPAGAWAKGRDLPTSQGASFRERWAKRGGHRNGK
ncbi:MAG TPA: LutB/LldF family L-lactate oxidation iron-sulfur protein [Capsulimonadaceae bacterium]|jgi:L-lactate dehydrogenase complex protein LldF